MEEPIPESPAEAQVVDWGDAKYVYEHVLALIGSLETVKGKISEIESTFCSLQEAKDEISRIESIFCRDLYPNFQSKYKTLQKIYSEAKKAAEDLWKEKENKFILQVEKLQLEKEMMQKEHEERIQGTLEKLRSKELKIQELEKKLMFKEDDEGIELQRNLIRLIQTKANVIVNKDKQLREHEKKIDVLLADLKIMENKVEFLQKVLREKIEEVIKGKELEENLLGRINLQTLEIKNNEQLLIDYEREKKQLMTKFEQLKENLNGVNEELKKKTEEVEEGRKLQEGLLKLVDSNGSENLRTKQQLAEHKEAKELLLTKVKDLEEKVNELQLKLQERSDHEAKEGDFYKKLIQQIEPKDSELLAEQNKYMKLLDGYKRLKSQYNYLLSKKGLNLENVITPHKSERARHHHHENSPPANGNKTLDAPAVACDLTKVKDETIFNDNSEDEKGLKSIQTSRPRSPNSNLPTAQCVPSTKSYPVAGRKRPFSGWRETRSRQQQGGSDPHDDFLDTPLENIRGNLSKVAKEDHPGPVPEGIQADSSDDETQDLNVDPTPENQEMPIQIGDKRNFKYVEPIRKKSERENLKGFECNQCKKFYDAVLDDGSRNNDSNKHNIRCEHHQGVSRHRYKYNPPLTPEGFWNIGFESEM
ncbi:hypothetical protein SLEP1_g50690 [Rubroshorea leprosula]|uniref:DNA endonuclease activator Ctp1 C-terminal domain-containing protein n=1 Tax=Rubroshorea leprosula TaxID=152421 RepID=A0AAV5M388_9ROSI|nr:hypothetical protein SLEP1_g50690 [Rubroshorea leprosula]